MVSCTHQGWGHWRGTVGSKPSWPIQGIDRQKDSLGSQKKHGEAMKVGDLVRIQHFTDRYNGKIAIVMRVCKRAGFVDSYAVKVPSMRYEIVLAREQYEVLNEGG